MSDPRLYAEPQLSNVVEHFLAVLGSEHTTISLHWQRYEGRRRLFTVVGDRQPT